MFEIYQLVWAAISFILSFTVMFYALQALDFSKLFKKNSTWQIKAMIVLVSAAIAFMIALGIGNILELISSIK